VDHELEVIRDQMEGTRASLADKLEALESQVRETVQSASETVASAVDGAKDVVSSVSEGAKQVVEKVSETVETVKESLSITHCVEQYPWASVGVAVAAGFCTAQLLPPLRAPWAQSEAVAPPADSYRPRTSEPPRHEPSPWTDSLTGVAKTAATTLEGLAVGTLMGAIKDLITRSLPQEWHGELNRMADDVTTRLGGKVMHGNPLGELLSSLQPQHQDNPPAGPGARV
jgi:ElaB/YqjD/DUF883 family membrane-anchored ribosome-binding protein